MSEQQSMAEIHRHLAERYPMYRTDNAFEQWLLRKTGVDHEKIDAYLDLLYGYGYFDGEGTLAGDYTAVPDPDNVIEDIRDRLAKLSPEDCEVLRIASVEGAYFSESIVRELAGKSGERIDSAIRAGSDAGMVVRTTPAKSFVEGVNNYRFRPLQAREILYEELGDEERVRLHSALVEHLSTLLERAGDPGAQEMLTQMINEHNNLASRPSPLPSSEERKP